MKEHQRKFIDFLIASNALMFGDFTTKSGRKTPYFVNTGKFQDGAQIAELGRFYASHIIESGIGEIDSVFGPAYKGIPLCVSTTIALSQNYNRNIGYTFNRKENKDHGDKGSLVGKALKANNRVVIVEDVVTAGMTLREVIPMLRNDHGCEVAGVVIAVDRCEKGESEISAVQEAEHSLDIKVYSIVKITEILSYLSDSNSSGFQLSSQQIEHTNAYRQHYGVNE